MVFYLTVLLQVFSQTCFCLKDFVKIVTLLLAALGNDGPPSLYDTSEHIWPCFYISMINDCVTYCRLRNDSEHVINPNLPNKKISV